MARGKPQEVIPRHPLYHNEELGSEGSYTKTEADATFLRLSGGTMTGALLASQGAVGAPGLSFTGDPDTGISPLGTADELSLITGGARRARLTNSKLGIFPGATTPASGRLQVGAGVTDYGTQHGYVHAHIASGEPSYEIGFRFQNDTFTPPSWHFQGVGLALGHGGALSQGFGAIVGWKPDGTMVPVMSFTSIEISPGFPFSFNAFSSNREILSVSTNLGYTVSALLVASNGDMWVGPRFNGAVAGDLHLYMENTGACRWKRNGAAGDLMVLANNGTLTVVSNDVEVQTASKGLILKSAIGTRYRVTVTDAGALQTALA